MGGELDVAELMVSATDPLDLEAMMIWVVGWDLARDNAVS